MNRELSIRAYHLVTLSCLIILAPLACFADLYECNGIWTNKPCEGVLSESIPSVKTNAKPTKTPANEDKRTLTHDFVTHAYNIKNKHGIDYPIRFIEQKCLSDETTLEECKKLLKSHYKILDKKVSQKTSKKNATVKKVKVNKTKIVVVNNPAINNQAMPTISPTQYPLNYKPGPFKIPKSPWDKSK